LRVSRFPTVNVPGLKKSESVEGKKEGKKGGREEREREREGAREGGRKPLDQDFDSTTKPINFLSVAGSFLAFFSLEKYWTTHDKTTLTKILLVAKHGGTLLKSQPSRG
jgi:hypothetical protein